METQTVLECPLQLKAGRLLHYKTRHGSHLGRTYRLTCSAGGCGAIAVSSCPIVGFVVVVAVVVLAIVAVRRRLIVPVGNDVAEGTVATTVAELPANTKKKNH